MKHPNTRAQLLTLKFNSRNLPLLTILAISLLAFAGIAAALPQQQNQQQQDQSGQSTQGTQKNQTPSSQTGQSSAQAPPPDTSSSADTKSDKPKDKDKDKDAQSDVPVSRLRVTVTSADGDKPIGNASVYVRYPDGYTRLTHKEKLAEMNFKTNLDGSVKIPDVPRGKVLLQVVAPGWHTYGKWYDISEADVKIEIKLDKPPHWY
jgi:cytoskeletal protein RodZ